MPDYPVVSGDGVVRAPERPGFAQVRQRGSHVVMRLGEQGCVVPLRREINRRTLGGLVRQAGVDPTRFIAALRQ